MSRSAAPPHPRLLPLGADPPEPGCARVAVCVCVAQTLGVPLGTSKADCKKAYFRLAKIWHPDKHQQVSSFYLLYIRAAFSRARVAPLEGQLPLPHLPCSGCGALFRVGDPSIGGDRALSSVCARTHSTSPGATDPMPQGDIEAATLKYKEIQAAYDRLMSSDEDAAIEALTAGGVKR